MNDNKVYLPTSASFLVTEDCNLACTYCFELGGRNKNKMTKEVARQGIEYLCNNAIKNGDGDFHAMLFGGEPLLNVEVVEEIFEYGLELSNKYNLNFTTSMVTNATILTTEVKRVLNKYKNIANLHVQLSVDGIKEIHDKYRVTKNGKGSFDIVEKNMPEWKALFADNMDRLSVHGCSNHDTLPYLYENYIFFREKWDIPRIWFMPIHSETWDNEDVKVYEEQLNKIADYTLDRARKEGDYQEVTNYAPIDRCLSPDSFPSAPCGAGKNFVTITASGELFPCHQMYFNDPDKITKIGDLDNGIDELKRKLYVEYDNSDLSCAKVDPTCDAYHCYRCIAENLSQNGSILSVVGCGAERCDMSKIERKIQLRVKKELDAMGLLNNNQSDCRCDSRESFTGDCDVVVQCEGNTRGLNGGMAHNRECDCENKNDDNDTIAMALKLILDRVDTIEKEQALILKKTSVGGDSMGLSLRELKDELIAKGGYTITPNHNQLADLKILVDDMMNVRSESPPSSGSGNYSGTNCIGHITQSEYELSLGNINDLDIKGCSCHTVNDTTAYCRSRTYSCSCNSNTPTCTCNGRTVTTCNCVNRTFSICSCESRTNSCNCDKQNGMRVMYGACSCNNDITPTCTCDGRTGIDCQCRNRTSDCGSRNTTSCTCNGRCACNVEKRFE